MKKTIIGLLVGLGVGVAHADISAAEAAEIQDMHDYAQSLGLPTHGVKIVDKLSGALGLPHGFVNENAVHHKEFRKNGYWQDRGDDVKKFLTTEQKYTAKNAKDLHLAYKYKPIIQACQAPITTPNGTIVICDGYIVVIGADPIIKQLPTGWTGVSEYFTHPKLGKCKYTENNAQLSKAAAIIEKNRIDDYIGDIPVLKDVHGNINTGFLYEITWYSPQYFRELQCAKEGVYDVSIIENMTAIAHKIESLG